MSINSRVLSGWNTQIAEKTARNVTKTTFFKVYFPHSPVSFTSQVWALFYIRNYRNIHGFFFPSFVAHSHLDIYMKTDMKTPWFSDLFIIKGWSIYSVYGMQCSKLGLWKGAPFANTRYKRGVPLRSKLVFLKGRGLDRGLKWQCFPV